MNHTPYLNLPNGQYIQNQVDSRFPVASHPNINNVTNITSKGFDMERLQKAHKQAHDHDHSNSDSSSDSSDDSNNESDSSSADSDAEKDDKEICANRVVKPLRLNLTKVCKFFHIKFNFKSSIPFETSITLFLLKLFRIPCKQDSSHPILKNRITVQMKMIVLNKITLQRIT